jgi:hypothetical protein
MRSKAVNEKTLSEGQMVNLVRNALLVAGQEMGEDGDHWPVIKSTIHKMMQDWEQLQIERNVDAELKIHLDEVLRKLGRAVDECAPEDREFVTKKFNQLKETYNAYFQPVQLTDLYVDKDELPVHAQRAEQILQTLVEE